MGAEVRRVGVDLLWVRPGKNGGTESAVRNLLDGLAEYASGRFRYVLYVAEDNAETFARYGESRAVFELRRCPVRTADPRRRVVWENLRLPALFRKDGIDLCFFPVYSRPLLGTGDIPNVTLVHDIQAARYPEYFSRLQRAFYALSWRADYRTGARILTVSEFCRRDMADRLGWAPEKIGVLYNTVRTPPAPDCFPRLAERYGIEDGEYYFTVLSAAPHKNLKTLLEVMRRLRERGGTRKLVVAGVGYEKGHGFHGQAGEAFPDVAVFAGFLPDGERDALYDHCAAFLFPSLFEGFGMPPVEAAQRGVPVVSSGGTSLGEVLRGHGLLVADPLDPEEWIAKLREAERERGTVRPFVFDEYRPETVVRRFEEELETAAGRGAGGRAAERQDAAGDGAAGKARVFVVLVNYRNAGDTVECVESLAALRKDGRYDVRIVVVDNHSEDGSAQKIRAAFPGLDVVEAESNRGFAAGNNLGVRFALERGATHVLLLNNDTLAAPELLRELLARSAPDVVTVPKIYACGSSGNGDGTGGGERIWYAGGGIDRKRVQCVHYGEGETDAPENSRERDVDFASGCCLLLPREAVEKAGPWDESYFLYFEDFDYSLALAAAGIRVRYVPTACLRHKVSRTTGGHAKPANIYYMVRNRYYLARKFGFGWRARAYVLVVRTLRAACCAVLRRPGRVAFRAWRDYRRGAMGRQDV